jgi:Ca2+-binding RTX toxin-like protein
MVGGRGEDTVRGAAGPDFIDDYKGADVLYGGIGRDRLQSVEGRNRLIAGPGNDRLYVLDDRRRDVLNCGEGHDRVRFYDYRDRSDRLVGCERIGIEGSDTSMPTGSAVTSTG